MRKRKTAEVPTPLQKSCISGVRHAAIPALPAGRMVLSIVHDRSSIGRIGFILICVACFRAPTLGGQRAESIPAEERRLNTAVFREGLKKRGLLEILELHLKDYPPQSGAEQLLLEREARLGEFRDARLPPSERTVALEKANAALDRLVRENPEDQRRFQWLFALAHSLVFEQGAPYATSILYTGGSQEDREKLAELSARALKTTRDLIDRLEAEFARIDGLTPGQFGRLENTPYMAELDRIAPNADYLLLWALFYDSLPRPDDDAARVAQLNEILEHLSRDPLILKAPQEQTHVQVPATVLAGTTYRHLGDYHNARLFLDRARALADRLTDAEEKASIQWAVVLAEIEGIRADRDDQRWPAAEERIAKLRERLHLIRQDQGVDVFSLQMVAALLERTVHLRRAEAVEKTGRHREAEELRQKAWQGLAQLVTDHPSRRDDIFAAINRAAPTTMPPEEQDPIELVARIAGLLGEADEHGGSRGAGALAQAAVLAQHFLEHRGQEAESLAPQVLRFLAVAQYRTGDTGAASATFTRLACSYPRHADAKQAAVYGVQLAAKLHQQQSASSDAKKLYRGALQCLLESFADSEQADYWRFFYAQLLDELGEHDEAAAQYALIKPGHQQFVESAYLRMRSLAQVLQKNAESEKVGALATRADAIATAFRELQTRISKADSGDNAKVPANAKALLAEGVVLTAESAISPRIQRYQYAEDLLADFESRYPLQADLLGRVWRVRLMASYGMGQTDKLPDVIANYLAQDTTGAGRTLQALYHSSSKRAEESSAAGAAGEAEAQAKMALLFAEQLSVWADARGQKLSPEEKKYILVQLGESANRAMVPLKARAAFAGILPPSSDQLPSSELDLRIMLGHARALVSLDKCQEALPVFNQLATGLQATSPLRWEAMLGDLLCRTQLSEPPEGILKVIEQQKLLYPELGGSAFSERFELLRRENQRRLTPQNP